MRTSAFANGQTWDLPVPAQGASTHARFFDPAGSPSLAISCLTMLPSAFKTASAPGTVDFVAQWLAYALPYRRFVGRPRERQRTARGRCGSLHLHRVGLSPTTPCRSPGALRIRCSEGTPALDSMDRVFHSR